MYLDFLLSVLPSRKCIICPKVLKRFFVARLSLKGHEDIARSNELFEFFVF